MAVGAERDARHRSPVLLELHQALRVLEVEQHDGAVQQADGGHIDGGRRRQHGHRRLKVGERVHELRLLDVPQLQAALLAAQQDFVHIGGRMHERAHTEVVGAQRQIEVLGAGANVPHLQHVGLVDGDQVLGERQHQVHVGRVAGVRVPDDVAAAPREDAPVAGRVHAVAVAGQAGDVGRMQAGHADQAKVIAAVRVEQATDAGDDDILLAAPDEAHGGRHVVGDVAERPVAAEQFAAGSGGHGECGGAVCCAGSGFDFE